MAPNDPLDELNDDQRRAATFGLAAGVPARPGQALLVVAGAGTGKTTTLAHRVARLIVHGADPGRIMLLTFTRRAAEEMRKRAASIIAAGLGADVGAGAGPGWAGTFHAIGARLLRDYAGRIGLEPGFGILDRADAEDLLDLVRAEAGLGSGDRRFPRKATCLAIYSRATNTDAPLHQVIVRDFPWVEPFEPELSALLAAYVVAKQRQGLLDYDDLLLWWSELLGDAGLAAEIGDRFDFVLVDEYQDTNPLQARILQRLKPGGLGVTVIGDDAQSIFSFRGATVRNILDFPGACVPPAAIVTLQQNFRSTQPILDLANALLAQARETHRKRLRSDRGSAQRPWLVVARDEACQATYVADQVLHAREAGALLRDQAVLARTAAHTARLELELSRRRIPFRKFGGLRFLEAAHVRDVLALVRWLDNPRDRVSGFRLLKLLPGIGPGFARRVLDAIEAGGLSLAAIEALRPPPAAQRLWQRLVELVQRDEPWPRQMRSVRLLYEEIIAELHGAAPDRLLDLDQLDALAALQGSRRAFLDELAVDPPAAHGDLAGPPHRDEDYLTLSTIHSAKGREWRAVHLLYLIDGWIPSDMATGRPEDIEEELRLLYVAVTRARDELHLIQPLRIWLRPQGTASDRWVAGARSRFLPPGVLHLLEGRAWPPPDAARPAEAGPAAGGAAGPPIDIAARVRAKWH